MKASFWIALSGAVAFTAFVGAARADDAETCTKAPGDPAIAACTRAIASGQFKGPKLADLQNKLAYNHLIRGDFDKALAAANAALAADPKSFIALFTRANANMGKGSADAAIADYTAALAIEPKFAPALTARGDAYRAKGDFDRALADFTQALAGNPKNAQALTSRGDLFRAKGDLDRAVADYTQAIAADPEYPMALFSRASTYRSKGDLDKVVEDATKGVKLDPTTSVFLLLRGKAYWAKGDFARAIADATEAARVDPDSRAGALFDRGLYEASSGAPAKAVADLTEAAKLDASDPYTALWLDIVNKRSKLPSRLSEVTAQMDMSEWPAPLIRLYLGQTTPDAVIKAAGSDDAAVKKTQVCEANFFMGELSLGRDAKDEAAKLFNAAVADCAKDSNEWAGANAALKTLGAKP